MLIALAVGFVMTFIATRTRFGRYVFAIGGNPEAAELAGINTSWLTIKVFTLMGCWSAFRRVISSARLDAATNALGHAQRALVIAAAVIGGTSLAGGIGTISGAMLGALLMQSLQSGMVLLNLESAYKNIVVGSVLVLAVFVDQVYRRRVEVREAIMAQERRRGTRWSRCATSRSPSAASRRSITPRSIFIPARWSGCSATTAPANRR